MRERIGQIARNRFLCQLDTGLQRHAEPGIRNVPWKLFWEKATHDAPCFAAKDHHLFACAQALAFSAGNKAIVKFVGSSRAPARRRRAPPLPVAALFERSDQVDPPAEDHAGGDATAAADLRHAYPTPPTLLHHR